MLTRGKFRWNSPADLDASGELMDPRRHLIRLINQVCAALRSKGYQPTAPDRDWLVGLAGRPDGVGFRIGYFDGRDDGFFCFIEPYDGKIRHLLGKTDVQLDVMNLQATIDSLLRADPNTSNLKWSTFEDYDSLDL
jgi:hypothetical protein